MSHRLTTSSPTSPSTRRSTPRSRPMSRAARCVPSRWSSCAGPPASRRPRCVCRVEAPDDAVWARVTAQIDTEDRLEGTGGAERVPSAPPTSAFPTSRPERVTRLDRFTRRRTAAGLRVSWPRASSSGSPARAIWSPDSRGQVAQISQVAQVPLSTLDTKQREERPPWSGPRTGSTSASSQRAHSMPATATWRSGS